MSVNPTQHTFSTDEELREYIGRPADLAKAKAIDHLDKHCRAYIKRSPFICIGTAASTGQADVSPRGDAPGFVQVLDEKTIFIPERPGNKRLDTLGNIIENPNVGIFFLVPGFEVSLRINGKATIVRDERLLEKATVKGKVPKLGIRVHVDEAYLHCAKAIKRSKIWDENSKQDRGEMPSLGRMVLEQVAPPDQPPSAEVLQTTDDYIEDNYKNELY